MMNTITKKILSIALLVSLAIGVAADDNIDPNADVNVSVNAPEYVSDTFEVTIDVTEVTDLNSGQFDLIFDPNVINIDDVNTDIEAGNIDDIEIPIVGKRRLEDGQIRVLFKLSGADGVSGSGYVAKITFEVVGATGDNSAIDVADDSDEDEPPNLSDCIGADEIPANWFGTNVTIGTAPSMPAETPAPTPARAPAIVAASAPTSTATVIETSSFESASNPSASTARAQGAPAAAVPSASSENDGLQDLLTTHNFITIYSFIGLLAFIYTLTLLK